MIRYYGDERDNPPPPVTAAEQQSVAQCRSDALFHTMNREGVAAFSYVIYKVTTTEWTDGIFVFFYDDPTAHGTRLRSPRYWQYWQDSPIGFIRYWHKNKIMKHNPIPIDLSEATAIIEQPIIHVIEKLRMLCLQHINRHESTSWPRWHTSCYKGFDNDSSPIN